YEMVMPYHLHMPSYFLETFTEYPYLVWLDCRELELSQKDLNEFFVDKAHLALNDGEMFGKEGIGFMRLNVASPRCIIEKAMKQLADAYQLYIK
ncbi:hypothetical protein AAH130_19880, partial [Phocaeicola vulgatus]